MTLGAIPPEVGDQRIVGVQDQGRFRLRSRRSPRTSARRSCRARRTCRADRGTGFQAAAPGGATRRRWPATRIHRPRTGRAVRRFRRRGSRSRAAWRRCRRPYWRPRGCGPARTRRTSRIEAVIAAVVVLPLVAEITTLPFLQAGGETADCMRLESDQEPPRQAGAAATAAGSDRRTERPGDRDLRLERGHGRRIGTGRRLPTGTRTETAPGSMLNFTGNSAIGSPSAYTVNGLSASTST